MDRGVIGPGEAEVARNEAARRLMNASQRDASGPRRGSPWIAPASPRLAVLIFVPAAALPLYLQIGAPSLPDEPLQARLDAAPANMDMATAIAKIEQHLVKQPGDGRGWAVLAPIYVRLERYDDAQRAFNNAIRLLNGPTADRYAALGEAQVFANNGMVTADAKKSFDEAAKLEPFTPRASFYLGLAAQQDGDKPKAVSIWRQLEAHSPPDAPWLPTVRNHIAEATGQSPPEVAATQPPGQATGQGQGGMPSGPMAAAVAAMRPDQQQAMIHRMVDGLAERLKSNGGDIDGWLRLVRAYRVLNEESKAKVALGDARRTFAANPTATKRLDDLAHELGLEG